MDNNKINKRWKWIKKIKKTKNNKKWEEDPNQDLKMRYFKIHLCRIFYWKVWDWSGSRDTCQWYFRSEIGVWQRRNVVAKEERLSHITKPSASLFYCKGKDENPCVTFKNQFQMDTSYGEFLHIYNQFYVNVLNEILTKETNLL